MAKDVFCTLQNLYNKPICKELHIICTTFPFIFKKLRVTFGVKVLVDVLRFLYRKKCYVFRRGLDE